MITRDRRIRYRVVERQAWIDHRVRGFVLTGSKSQTTRDSLTLLTRHWREMLTIIASEPVGPWMRSITQEGVRAIHLG